MFSKKYTRKQAERLLALRLWRIRSLYITLIDPPVHVMHLTVEKAVEMLATRYKTTSKMNPRHLQHKVNLWAATLQPERMYVFFHVEGADLPTFCFDSPGPDVVADAWSEYESHMRAWYKLRTDLLGI